MSAAFGVLPFAGIQPFVGRRGNILPLVPVCLNRISMVPITPTMGKIAVALADARQTGESAGWDLAVKACRDRGAGLKAAGEIYHADWYEESADHLASHKPSTPIPEDSTR